MINRSRIFLLMVFALTACRQHGALWPFQHPRTSLAWWENTTTTYQVMLSPSGRFYYTVGHRPDSDTLWDARKAEQHWEFYQGRWHTAGDTIYLNYKKGRAPQELAPFLIGAGWYYSQYLADRQHRVFLERFHFGGSRVRY